MVGRISLISSLLLSQAFPKVTLNLGLDKFSYAFLGTLKIVSIFS